MKITLEGTETELKDFLGLDFSKLPFGDKFNDTISKTASKKLKTKLLLVDIKWEHNKEYPFSFTKMVFIQNY